jgi:mRNA interferase MazF
MTRGDIVVVATKGAFSGKPRPALLVQSDLFNGTHSSLTLCPITSDCIDAPMFRVTLPPGARTGLRVASQVMVDKVVSVPRSSIAKGIGRCESGELLTVDDALRRWLALE